MAALAAMIPTIKKEDSRTVSFPCKNILEFSNLLQLFLIVTERDEIYEHSHIDSC